MNKYYTYWQETLGKNDRDNTFLEVLSYFNNKALNILEIGSIRNLNMEEGKGGDGYSTLFFCDYVKKNGGSITTIDSNLEAVVNCKQIVSDFINDINIAFIVGDGKEYINEAFDLVLLDGGDSFVECLQQFEKINRENTSVLIDDFHMKGILIKAKYRNYKLFQVNDGHQMAFYPSKQLQNNKNLVSNNDSNIIQNFLEKKKVEFDSSIINIVHETNQLKAIPLNNERLVIAVFYGENRDSEFLTYHKKVYSHFKIPINYVKCPFPGISHGAAIDNFVKSSINIVDYWVFTDVDCIPLFPAFVDFIYDKIRDKRTVFGLAHQSNHKIGPNGTVFHPYCGTGLHAISKELYLRLGSPTYDDKISRSDTSEEVTYKAEELGYATYIIWPSKTEGMTDEECKKHGIDPVYKTSKLGNGPIFGMGTTYCDLFYHSMCMIIPRSKDLFINECKKVLAKNV